MTMISIGDMAQSYALRRQNSQLSSQMTRLSLELSSGQTSNISSHLGGNYSYLGEIERGLRVLDSFQTATTEAGTFTSSMQSVLEYAQSNASDLSSNLLTVSISTLPATVEAVSNEAEGQLSSIISSLNTNIAGRSLFSGVATNSAALISADDMLAELRFAVAGQTSLADITAAVDNWFDTPGGGFETVGYLGSDTSMSPFMLGDGKSVDLDLRADDPAIRELLKHTAIAALAADSSLGYSTALQKELLIDSGEGLLSNQESITSVRANLGFAEARIEESSTRNAAEQTSLEYARGELLGVDVYDTATQLENLQFQLETLYVATVRLSQLSLVGYM